MSTGRPWTHASRARRRASRGVARGASWPFSSASSSGVAPADTVSDRSSQVRRCITRQDLLLSCWEVSSMRTAGTIAAAVLALAGPAAAYAAPGDTGVIDVSHTRDYSEGEQPLAVNPRNPNQLTTVANV